MKDITYRGLALILGISILFILLSGAYEGGDLIGLVSSIFVTPIFILYGLFGASFFHKVKCLNHFVAEKKNTESNEKNG